MIIETSALLAILRADPRGRYHNAPGEIRPTRTCRSIARCKERDVRLRRPAEVAAGDMGEGVDRRPRADSDLRDGQPIGAGGHAREQEHRSQTNLKRAGVHVKVLVVRLERGQRVEKRAGIDHRPRPERHEAHPDDDRDGAGQSLPQG